MATTVTRYISAGSTAGGDGTTTALSGDNRAYASIGEWVTARVAVNANFVTADVMKRGVCLPDAPVLERPDITGATTDATRYWWLTASVRNNGTAGAGVVIDNENTALAANAAILTLTNNHTRVYSLEIKNLKTATDSFGSMIRMAGSNCTIEGCLLHDCTTGDTQRPLVIRSSNSSTTAAHLIRNNIIYNFKTLRTCYGIYFADAGNCLVQNNTVVNLTGNGISVMFGISAGSRTTNTSQNNLVLGITGGSTNACFGGTWGTETNDESSDTTAAGAGSINSATAADEIVNATSGSENCHLKSGAQAINAGATLTLATDISNNVRPQGASWDIGADELISAASLIKTVNGLAIASVKTIDNLAIASVKTWNGLTNV